jgi:PAS domain S-box-containing protein
VNASGRLTDLRYRDLFDSMNDGLCVMELQFDAADRAVDYRFVETNSAFEEHTGLRNAVGRTAREMVPDLDESWFRLYGEVALTGKPARFENHAPAMGRWFEVFATRVSQPDLRLVALVFKNITERKQAEIKLQESEARFRNMADHAPVMMWVTAPDGGCTYLNRRWYEYTGQTEETGLGMGWLDAVHPDDAQQAGATFLSASAAREPFRLEYRLRGRDGTFRWAIDAAGPRFAADGEFLGYVGSVIDIEDRKRVERATEELLAREQVGRAQAEESSRIKDEFLATVSHELRTPLTSILGWVQMLRAGNLAPERRAQALEIVERNSRHQAQLIEDLLDVSRILAGKLRLDVTPLDLSDVVNAAMETVRPAADAKDIRLQAALDTSGIVMGDADRLQQVVWNLLANAVKFTPKGGRVQVAVTRRDSSVEVVVADTGKGIPESFLPFVFDRFRQADGGVSRAHGGLGLGLSIVRHIVELHGGTVSAHSDGEGRGASFVVTLPVAVVLRKEVGCESTPPWRSSAPDLRCPPHLEGLRVLVVDDEEDTGNMLRAMLESCSATVRVARSAAEALAMLRAEPPEVLVSDVGMPDQDGYSLIRAVRALPGPAGVVPSIALTAYAHTKDRTLALLAGFDMHLPKPVEPVELLTVVASMAQRKRAR